MSRTDLDAIAALEVQRTYMRRIVELDELVFALAIVGSPYQFELARAHRAIVWSAWQDECQLLREAPVTTR